MPVTIAIGATLNRRVGRYGVRAGIAFAGPGNKGNCHIWLAAGHIHVRDADGAVGAFRPNARTKIGVQPFAGANRVDVVGRVGMHRQRINGRVPDVVAGEDVTASDLGRRGTGFDG